MADKKRVHQACDPAPFLTSVEELKKEAGITSGKKPATKAKPKAKATTKRAVKTPRKKTPASRKGK
jgi:hypothetical protein